MSEMMLTIIAIGAVISLIGSVLIIRFVWKRKKKREYEQEHGITHWAENKGVKKQKSIGVWVFLILFGMIFECIGAGAMLSLKNKTRDWAEIPAVISYYTYKSSSKSIRVKVDYEYNGKKYENVPLRFKSTSMSKGQKVTLLVNQENPLEMEYDLKKQFRFFGIFIAVGTVFILFSVYQCVMELTGKSTWHIQGDPPVVLSGEQEKRQRIKVKIFIGLVVVGMYLFFYFIMPFPLFLFMVLWMLVPMVWGKISNLRNRDE